MLNGKQFTNITMSIIPELLFLKCSKAFNGGRSLNIAAQNDKYKN